MSVPAVIDRSIVKPKHTRLRFNDNSVNDDDDDDDDDDDEDDNYHQNHHL